VTIEDNTGPECLTQDITVYLDGAGNATIGDGDVDNGSNDACGIESFDVSPNAFTCADIGDNVVTQTVSDVNGNVSTCTATVSVQDTIAPTCSTQDITLQLDVDGNASIDDDALDAGSTDNCAVDTIILSQTDFTCADVGDIIVTQTVIDDSGNSSSCTATVTVEDNIAPECLTQDITVQLDGTGMVTITDDAVDDGSNDACGIDTIVLSQTTFNCDDLGVVVVTQTVTDVNGNVSSCSANVTVEDNVAPVVTCPGNLTVACAADVPAVNTGDVMATDNCGGSVTIGHVGDVISNQTCANQFVVTRTYRATDAAGNTADCAQAHGAEYKGQKIGTFGIASAFSFFPSKNLGAFGDAGAIVTNDIKLADQAKMISNHGQLNVKHSHKVIGRNSRLDSIQASVLSVKLKHLDEWNQKRINAAISYKLLLSKKNGVILPIIEDEKKHVFHLFVIKCKNRPILTDIFEKNHISFGIHYPKALPFLEAYQYKNLTVNDFPVASRLTDEILSLPIYPEITKSQIELICNLILDN
jgi:hypothetical protein